MSLARSAVVSVPLAAVVVALHAAAAHAQFRRIDGTALEHHVQESFPVGDPSPFPECETNPVIQDTWTVHPSCTGIGDLFTFQSEN